MLAAHTFIKEPFDLLELCLRSCSGLKRMVPALCARTSCKQARRHAIRISSLGNERPVPDRHCCVDPSETAPWVAALNRAGAKLSVLRFRLLKNNLQVI